MMPDFYAVKVGRTPGIYSTWADCEAQVKGSAGAVHKKFKSRKQAEAWYSGNELPVVFSGAAKSVSSRAAKSDSKGKKRKASSPDVEDETGWDVVYSDGAAKGNGQKGAVAGVGVWWGRDDPRNLAERCPGAQTNNRAELIAILRILETTPQSKRPLLIKTDSQYSKKCFGEWIHGWIKRNWRTATGEAVKNAPLIKYIHAHLDARARRGQRMRLQYVKAHNGEEGNEGADAQANLGVLEPEEAERDWSRLEAELKGRLDAELATSPVMPQSVLLEVVDEDGSVATPSLEQNPTKIRKTSAVIDEPKFRKVMLPVQPTAVPRAPLAAIPPKPSSSQITSEDLADYADCILDDGDLLAELSD
ncbi:ribonuclease H-like protein [Mycena vulgaris]|nr:ribonuclease H-like protein [Mycena vulgaris]